jgi:hypothetical protein
MAAAGQQPPTGKYFYVDKEEKEAHTCAVCLDVYSKVRSAPRRVRAFPCVAALLEPRATLLRTACLAVHTPAPDAAAGVASPWRPRVVTACARRARGGWSPVRSRLHVPHVERLAQCGAHGPACTRLCGSASAAALRSDALPGCARSANVVPAVLWDLKGCVERLRVFCRFGRRAAQSSDDGEPDPAGCPAVLRRDQVDAHEASCGFAFVSCPVVGCGTELRRRQLAEHNEAQAAQHASLQAAAQAQAQPPERAAARRTGATQRSVRVELVGTPRTGALDMARFLGELSSLAWPADDTTPASEDVHSLLGALLPEAWCLRKSPALPEPGVTALVPARNVLHEFTACYSRRSVGRAALAYYTCWCLRDAQAAGAPAAGNAGAWTQPSATHPPSVELVRNKDGTETEQTFAGVGDDASLVSWTRLLEIVKAAPVDVQRAASQLHIARALHAESSWGTWLVHAETFDKGWVTVHSEEYAELDYTYAADAATVRYVIARIPNGAVAAGAGAAPVAATDALPPVPAAPAPAVD